jgi:hypothetical protein
MAPQASGYGCLVPPLAIKQVHGIAVYLTAIGGILNVGPTTESKSVPMSKEAGVIRTRVIAEKLQHQL